MSGGNFTIDRSIWDHPVFRSGKFTDAQAFIWLISEARWKRDTIRSGALVIDLKRGQLSHSVRFLGNKWGWSKSAIHRFLKTLENRDMIEVGSGTGQTIITICNYDKYQNAPNGIGTHRWTHSGTAAGQQRDKEEYQIIPDNTIDDDVEAREAKNGIEILTPREQIIISMGHDKSGITATGRMVGNPADMLELGRWQDDLGLSLQEVIGVIEAIRAGSNKPPPTVFRYYEKPMQEFAGRKNAQALEPIEGGQNGNGNYNGGRGKNGGASGAHAGLIAGLSANAERFAAEDAAASRAANQENPPRLVAKEDW